MTDQTDAVKLVGSFLNFSLGMCQKWQYIIVSVFVVCAIRMVRESFSTGMVPWESNT
jgi:hypothetical protein